MPTELSEDAHASLADDVARATSTRPENLKITLISIHGLIRARDPELGRDADTGGQVKYVLELARELAEPSECPRSRVADPADRRPQTRRRLRPVGRADFARTRKSSESRSAPNAICVKSRCGRIWKCSSIRRCRTFKRTGLPDIIHGHYADAGLVGRAVGAVAAHSVCVHRPFAGTRQTPAAFSGQGRRAKRWKEGTNSPRGSKPKKSRWKPPRWW